MQKHGKNGRKDGWTEGRKDGEERVQNAEWKPGGGKRMERQTQETTMGDYICSASDGASVNELLPGVYCSQRGVQCAEFREDCCWRADISLQPDTHILIPLRIFHSSARPYFCLAASYIRHTGILFTAQLAEQSPVANKFTL